MIYLYHDFYSNFMQSLKYGEADCAVDMLANEISDLITYEPQKLIDLLNKVGIVTKDDISDEELLDKTFDNFNSNIKLQMGFAFIIAEGNDVIDSKTTAKNGKILVTNLAKGLTPTLKNILQDINKRREFKNSVMSSIKLKASKVDNRTRKVDKPVKKNRTLLYVIIFGVAVFLIYRYRKKIFPSLYKEKAAEGAVVGQVDNGGNVGEPAVISQQQSVESEFNNYNNQALYPKSVQRPIPTPIPIQNNNVN